MKTKALILLALLFGIAISSSAKRKKDAAPIPGLIYHLPRTVVKITVDAQYTQIVPGPYAKYADTFLGIAHVPTKEEQIWKLQEIHFNTFSEADPAQQYQSLGEIGSLVSLTNKGVIAGINTTAPTQTKELNYSSFVAPKVKMPVTNFTNLTLNGRTYTVTDSTGTHVFQKTDKEMAEEAAQTIVDLRQQRYDLLAGALDSREITDAQSLQAAAEKLSKLEQEYLSLFIGTSYSASCSFTFDYVPTPADASGKVAFRFSKSKGPVPADDLSGAPIRVNINTPQALAEGFGNAPSEYALYYRIPGKASLSLNYADKTLATVQLDLAQFGSIMPIPNQLLDGRFEIKINPETGAIIGSKQIIFDTDSKKR